MQRVTSTEFQQSVGAYSDTALREPVVITSHNRDKLVLMDVEEYNRLKEVEAKAMNDFDRLLDDSVQTHRSTIEKLALR